MRRTPRRKRWAAASIRHRRPRDRGARDRQPRQRTPVRERARPRERAAAARSRSCSRARSTSTSTRRRSGCRSTRARPAARRRVGSRSSTPPTRGWRQLRPELRAEARQRGHQLPRVHPGRHHRLALAEGQPLRPGDGELQGRAGLQPDARRRAGARRLPPREVRAGRGGRAGLQPVHPDRGIAGRLRRADRRGRRRRFRRRAPHEHRRSRAGHPHRTGLPGRQVPGVLGRHPDRQGLRRGSADRVPVDRGRPAVSAVLERATYVPALDKVAYNGGDDFLGSARERLFGFINGQTGKGNEQAQGFQHLALDGHVSEDASASNRKFINALRNGGDLLNVFGTSRRWRTRATPTPTARCGTRSCRCGPTRRSRRA